MFWRQKKKNLVEFDEIFLDASNLPSFNQGRMEGRIELPITKRSVYFVGLIFTLVAFVFLIKLFHLQVVEGASYRDQSEYNRINEGVIIAERGVIYDRNGELLAWNENDYTNEYSFPVRAYTDRLGLGQIIGYVSYPLKDKKGFYFRTEYLGRNGIEGAYNDVLSGTNGKRLVEVDALGTVVSEHAINAPQSGSEIVISLDAGLSEAMYDIIATSTVQAGFRSGAAAIMDIHTGEIIGLTSYPSYDPEVMAYGDDVALIEQYNNDDRFPFLNKVIGGAYAPGSIVKPFMAYAALNEKIISPDKIIVSNGQLVLPNRYNPDNPSIFRDWRVQGPMDMRKAIAFSSNVYFYIIGGGFGDQPGLGITKINHYMDMFGFGHETGIKLQGEQEGVVPSPAWKAEIFNDDWRVGDTYHTSIGQYGFLSTPLQMLRAYGALANGGKLFTPHLELGETSEFVDIGLNEEYLNIIQEGMRMTVNFPGGTARSLERSDVAIAAKSGTAELGSDNAHVNSWAAGYFPYENPQYAFILMMDRAPRSNMLGGTKVMGDIVEWMSQNRPEYLGIESTN
jgi:penicillin-binding protein 2